jgi:hypothetical protein
MKRHSVAILIAITMMIVGCKKKPVETAEPVSPVSTPQPEVQYQEILIGEWTGSDNKNQQGGFIFNKNGDAYFISDGQKFGGSDGNWTLKYQLDLSQKPIHLDFIGVDENGNTIREMLSIIEFISPDEIKVRTYFNEERPIDFLEDGIEEEDQSTINLSKQ